MKIFRDFKTKNLVTPSKWNFWVQISENQTNGARSKTLVVDQIEEEYLKLVFNYHLKVDGFLTEDFKQQIIDLVLKPETVPGFYVSRTIDTINVGFAKQDCYHAWCYLDSDRFRCFDCKVDLGDYFFEKNSKRKNKVGKLWSREWRKREFFI